MPLSFSYPSHTYPYSVVTFGFCLVSLSLVNRLCRPGLALSTTKYTTSQQTTLSEARVPLTIICPSYCCGVFILLRGLYSINFVGLHFGIHSRKIHTCTLYKHSLYTNTHCRILLYTHRRILSSTSHIDGALTQRERASSLAWLRLSGLSAGCLLRWWWWCCCYLAESRQVGWLRGSED